RLEVGIFRAVGMITGHVEMAVCMGPVCIQIITTIGPERETDPAEIRLPGYRISLAVVRVCTRPAGRVNALSGREVESLDIVGVRDNERGINAPIGVHVNEPTQLIG